MVSLCISSSRFKIIHALKCSRYSVRYVFSVSGSLDPELTHDVKKDIEKYWRDKINLPHPDENAGNKYYLLSMFPYPSGHLHMGHMRVYTISDTIARFLKMKGKMVIHPIGWDAFGLPAENAAIHKNIHPAEWTEKNIEAMRKQLQMLNICFDWDRELSTCDPKYYKWTQYLFLLLYEKGLAYKQKALVNWDPVDQTVLANEQVDEDGRSWRSGCKVEKRVLTQWFLRTTAFTQELFEGLSDPVLINWRDITKIQQHWIGECSGYTLHLKLYHQGEELSETLPVWTDTPELVYGATFVSVSIGNLLNAAEFGGGTLYGTQRLDIEAVHPLTGSLLPIFATNEFDHPESTESLLGIPGISDEMKFNFALRNELDIIPVTDSSSKFLINSEEFSRLPIAEAKSKILEKMKTEGVMVYPSSKTLRDWLISRQRYWGTPIPMINCPSCKTVPVPFEDLPVVLPHVDDFKEKSNTLSSIKEWMEVQCPSCGGPATRETDTMDTFVDSSWYYLRYLDVNNSIEPFSSGKVKELMPVDLYIGGKEHALLHLFYARFMAHFCHSVGLLQSPEPFRQLLMQGMIFGKTYQVESSGKYISRDEVDTSVDPPVEKSSRLPVVVDWQKMSKSKFNGVDPEEVVEEHGIDTARLFILFSVAPESPRKWNDELFPGIWNWQRRIWLTVSEFISLHQGAKAKGPELSEEEVKSLESKLLKEKVHCIRAATQSFLITRQISVVIARLQGLTNAIRGMPACLAKESKVYEETLASVLIMLAPIAPHFASELWSAFCSIASASPNYDIKKPVLHQKWPTVDGASAMKLFLKVDGATMDVVCLADEMQDLDKGAALQLASRSEKLQKELEKFEITAIDYKFWPDSHATLNYINSANKTKKKSRTKKENKSSA